MKALKDERTDSSIPVTTMLSKKYNKEEGILRRSRCVGRIFQIWFELPLVPLCVKVAVKMVADSLWI